VLPEVYVRAAVAVIALLAQWIGVHDPARTAPLTWPETLANVDHLADEGNVDAITMLIADYFADVGPDKALEVARCESGLRPWARNGRYVGLFQIGGADPDDPARENVAQARRMFDRRGWQPWACA
jgi:hypothetical protein